MATPLNAILNTDKTRILTTTLGKSLVDRMLSNPSMNVMMKGESLKRTIAKYSTTKIQDITTPVEVLDGMRVLGAPIGSMEFCQAFIMKALQKAEKALMISKLFFICTAHARHRKLLTCLE